MEGYYKERNAAILDCVLSFCLDFNLYEQLCIKYFYIYHMVDCIYVVHLPIAQSIEVTRLNKITGDVNTGDVRVSATATIVMIHFY